ncbi:MAG: conjugal transfer protein TraF [bacterium]
MNRSRIALRWVVAAALSALPGGAAAQELPLVGARAVGMGGASVAAVADESALFWNPGVLGVLGGDGTGAEVGASSSRRPAPFSVGLAALGGEQAFNDVGRAVEELVSIGSSGSLPTYEQALRLVDGLVREKWAAAALGNASVQARFGALAFGYRVDAEISGIPRPTLPVEQIDPATIDPANLPVELVYEGLILHEVPIAYGYAPTDWLSVGAAAKYLYGQTLVERTAINQVDPNDYFGSVFDHFQGSSAFGLDVGVLVHDAWWQVGLLGRNLTRPSFDLGPEGPVAKLGGSLALEPDVRLGFALHPAPNVTLAVDLDLLRHGALLDDLLKRGYDVQCISAGVEWLPLDVLALRLGILDNFAESDLGPELSAGVGTILGPLRIDLGGQFSFGSSDINAYSLPEELKVGLSIGFASD